MTCWIIIWAENLSNWPDRLLLSLRRDLSRIPGTLPGKLFGPRTWLNQQSSVAPSSAAFAPTIARRNLFCVRNRRKLVWYGPNCIQIRCGTKFCSHMRRLCSVLSSATRKTMLFGLTQVILYHLLRTIGILPNWMFQLLSGWMVGPRYIFSTRIWHRRCTSVYSRKLCSKKVPAFLVVDDNYIWTPIPSTIPNWQKHFWPKITFNSSTQQQRCRTQILLRMFGQFLITN